MALYLGIDAGGTKTDCAISNGAELLGQASGASCKLAVAGKEEGSKRLLGAVVHACQAAKIQPEQIDKTCMGMAGASSAEAVAWAQETLRQVLPTSEIEILGDHVVAHRAAFGISPGVLVIAGTGSIVFGRNQQGKTARAGGWGPIVSDEGSGYWIGKEAVTVALREQDRGGRNGLLSTIAAAWKVKPEEVVLLANLCAKDRFAELAQPVMAAAEKGDASAKTIAGRAGQELAALASAVIGKLWPEGGAIRVALSGGVVQGSPLVRQAFRDEMRNRHPDAGVSFAVVRPVLGALEIAADRGILR